MEKSTKIILGSALIIVSALALAIVFRLRTSNRQHITEPDYESAIFETVLEDLNGDRRDYPPVDRIGLEKILSILTDPNEHGTIYVGPAGEILRQSPWGGIGIDLDHEKPPSRMDALILLYKKIHERDGEDDW
jgi:hypothetical protein